MAAQFGCQASILSEKLFYYFDIYLCLEPQKRGLYTPLEIVIAYVEISIL